MVGLFNLQYLDVKLSYHYSFGIIRKLNVCPFRKYKYFGHQVDYVVVERKMMKYLGHLVWLFFHAEGTHVATPLACLIRLIYSCNLYFDNCEILWFHLMSINGWSKNIWGEEGRLNFHMFWQQSKSFENFEMRVPLFESILWKNVQSDFCKNRIFEFLRKFWLRNNPWTFWPLTLNKSDPYPGLHAWTKQTVTVTVMHTSWRWI